MAYIFPPKISEERLPEYEFFGRVVAKALFDGVAINCPLSRIIYKYLVDDIVDIDDLNFLDEDLFKSLNFMKDNSIEDVFFETFTVTKDYLGS